MREGLTEGRRDDSREAERGAEREAKRVCDRERVAGVARMLRVSRKSERSLHP